MKFIKFVLALALAQATPITSLSQAEKKYRPTQWNPWH